ncbi:hypothetical protein [Sporosarcina sp. FSL W7-1283]|uniref:hypothetical protein n=1 Tax=Sporosarcina sp. FSL W7-1283 TaxID=2921560 RepID=UPI0030F91BFC
MDVNQLKSIIMHLDEDYKVKIEDKEDPSETLSINSVEISLETKEVILKNW